MSMYHNRRTVADMRAMKARGQKISMLYVTNSEETAAAAAAGINTLSIEGRFMSPEMREAAGGVCRWLDTERSRVSVRRRRKPYTFHYNKTRRAGK